jgi:hypothetical protein
MCNETGDEGGERTEQTEPAAPEDRANTLEEALPAFPEHLRQAILESEARILAMWKKRGLFGLTTSTD